MLYFLRQIKEENTRRIPGLRGQPARRAGDGHLQQAHADCFDEEAAALVAKGINPIAFPGPELALTTDESKEINGNPEPKVILSASGMCEAGRILHHLKHNLWRPESTILFVGYQAEGTLGRLARRGAEEVTLFGEPIRWPRRSATLPGISGHADREGLLDWAARL